VVGGLRADGEVQVAVRDKKIWILPALRLLAVLLAAGEDRLPLSGPGPPSLLFALLIMCLHVDSLYGRMLPYKLASC
jgi:hypothetical protein